ncbi:MAG TPA: aspartate kinase [Acidimicrobiaceae bacterium]|nr:aspartate kinase [Actinomycetota bacterium]MDG1490106.1 aspartate kinase [Actinomycetota bacterium]MDG2120575.1 aspartate kinase [Actinomycetota bacterium]HAN07315.1 aspartate kinase [Acidimicrobiaceae bacterium]
MALLVQKFGGTSVADPVRMREVADHVKKTRSRGDQVVLVVSAMGKETDELLRLAKDVSSTPPGREMDMLITAGERKAIALMCMALNEVGVPADSFTGSQAGFITDTNHRNAKILSVDPHRVRDSVDKGRVAVVAGAQGMSTDSNVTFLGRGGSDTTAVALAHGLGADACELYTDVSGVFTTDPRVCPSAKRMESISFDELLEMTAVGCPKPVMRSVEVARSFGVPLHVRSAFTWEPGTWVVEEVPDMEQAVIKGIVPDVSQAKLTISGVRDEPGLAARVFRTLADAGVLVDMIVQNVGDHSKTDISFTVPLDHFDVAQSTCEEMAKSMGFSSVTGDKNLARVSVVGAGMASNPGVAATMFETLASNSINIEMISTSPIRISCVVAEKDVDRATVALHEAYGLGN